MRTVTARIFDYSLDGLIATEGTRFFDFCRELPDDQEQTDRTRAFYEAADVHLIGRTELAYWRRCWAGALEQ
jgi:hypothetical protein